MNKINAKMIGKVKIDGLECFNSINLTNMVFLIGRGLTGLQKANIFKLKIGNGGLNADQSLKQHKSSAVDTDLYSALNEHTVVVNQLSNDVGEGSSVVFTTTGNGGLIISITAVLTNPLSSSSDIAFNELALFSEDDLMLSHITFRPVAIVPGTSKSVDYSISFSIGE
jgi:hypothetical protein